MQDASSKQQTKQKYKPSHQQTGIPPHSALPIRGKTNKNKKKPKQTKKTIDKTKQQQQQQQNSAQISPYTKCTQTTGSILQGRHQKEERIQP